ncbi:putative FAD binding monooxygenase [Aspergillus fischeri NRRL 181]|uniref:FAD binding domain protein n=1 Tax=Neosartorya fischeri (strain ATCC 1020 / DSM 3700 / CBS 544.65 / FGSC A1164 / JCM 1740 / NRRL 181 / WB 181) TaxID=331117 RepID=A1D8P2_NEOFI|nr:FAD binding domain protein [Aspergillus fischeri NRRL 181]EAW20753.1 FAD binding domain protein [Aspergillus fischeri NRRL 181]
MGIFVRVTLTGLIGLQRMDPPFKVIIVGGSIAGLTLAHCLHRAEIPCIVLEKRPKIAPLEGASVAILPNGARILEQLGLYDAVEKLVKPKHVLNMYFPDGFQFSDAYPRTMNELFGFPMACLDRQQLLQVLYRLFPKRSDIYVGKSVIRVDQQDSRVLVYTADGSTYEGDLVVGADGVHSRVRTQMWRAAKVRRPGLFSESEIRGMSIEYACIFGASSTVPGLDERHLHSRVDNGTAFILVPGVNGRLSWFIIVKLDQKYQYGSAPRFSVKDAAAWGERLTDKYIWKDIKFEQVWQNRETVAMTALEENIFQNWSCGRIVCIGDSMHKMTPNLGQGANCAIEDAAALTNKLHDALRVKHPGHKLCDDEIEQVLSEFSNIQVKRISKIYNVSWITARLQTRANLVYRSLLVLV